MFFHACFLERKKDVSIRRNESDILWSAIGGLFLKYVMWYPLERYRRYPLSDIITSQVTQFAEIEYRRILVIIPSRF